MRPRLRRLDDVVAGAPVEVGGRVVTPRARRSGWVLTAGRATAFRVRGRPHSILVHEPGNTEPRAVPIRDRTWSVAAALAMVATSLALAAARTSRRSRWSR